MSDRNKEAMRIMEALSGVDLELLERCGAKEDWEFQGQEGKDHTRGKQKRRAGGKGRKPIWQYGRAWAACIALLMVGAVSWGAFRFVTMPHGSSWSDSKAGGTADGAAQEALTEGGVMEEGLEAGRGNVSEDVAMPGEGPGDMGQGSQEGGVNAGESGNGSAGGQAGGNGVTQDTEAGSKVEGGQGSAGGVSPGAGTQAVGDGRQEEDFTTDRGTPVSPYQEITKEQALSVEVLGAYIPSQLPAGYGLESVKAKISQEDGSTDILLLTWTRGMDYITLYISKTGTTQPATVDVDRPETYDLRLYGIPYGETVPEAYRESVMDPVFAWEDMSLEIVESRVVSPEGDAGDTDTPRGNFTVVYPDGVSVRFTGRGTPEEIWALFPVGR